MPEKETKKGKNHCLLYRPSSQYSRVYSSPSNELRARIMSNFRLVSGPLFPEWAGASTQNDSTESTSNMPSQWTNDDTMSGLFGPLDATNKNAMVLKHREARLEFWRDFLVSQFTSNPALSNVDPIISVPILAKLLKRKNVIPMGLSDIIVR